MGISSAMGPDALQPGLVLVKSQTVGTAVSSVTVSDAFNATYDNYKILYSGGVSSGTIQIRMQLSGITGGYYGGFAGSNYSTSAFYGQNDNNSSRFSWVGWGTTGLAVVDLEITSPYLVAQKLLSAKNIYIHAGSAYGTYVAQCGTTTSCTAFILSTNTGTMTGGTIRVYGYRN